MKLKKIILINIITILLILIINNYSSAVVQSSGGSQATYNLNDWMLNIRNMETLGSGMGLNEELNENLTSTTSNNIDIHMQKNTEYGALAILSASSYGNPEVIVSGGTTTGNKSGVVMNINNEWVAAGAATGAVNFKNAAYRYKNLYEVTYQPKIGDAITETNLWHGSTVSKWGKSGHAIVYEPHTGVVRAIGGSIFSYDSLIVGSGSYGNTPTGNAYWARLYNARAAIVVGQGL